VRVLAQFELLGGAELGVEKPVALADEYLLEVLHTDEVCAAPVVAVLLELQVMVGAEEVAVAVLLLLEAIVSVVQLFFHVFGFFFVHTDGSSA